MNEESRFRVELVRMTPWQRVRDWWHGVREAIRNTPETHYSKWIHVKPGDPGYEDATWGYVTDPNPLRYKFEKGQFVQVDMTEATTELNPNWTTPDERSP